MKENYLVNIKFTQKQLLGLSNTKFKFNKVKKINEQPKPVKNKVELIK